MTRAVAVAAHEIPGRPPLRIEPGEVVTAGRNDDEWPAFVYVTSSHGEGWVPERHLRRDAEAATVVVAYDTTELPVGAGEHLDILEEDRESGWAWCCNAAGRAGWVPLRVLRPL